MPPDSANQAVITPARIAIVGISGSGKSVFSRRLAEATGLPLIHMDTLFWRGAWQPAPEHEYLARHGALIHEGRWIIEGYVDEAMAERLARAELVVYLDFPGAICAWRLLRRWLAHRRTARPELPREAREELTFRFFRMVLARGERPDIERAIARAKPSRLVRLPSPRAARSFLSRTSSP